MSRSAVTIAYFLLLLAFAPFEFIVAGKLWGFHPGLYGLAINLSVAIVGSISLSGRSSLMRESEVSFARHQSQ